MESVLERERGVKTCPWCHDSRQCAKCGGTGQRTVKTRILHRAREAECRACEGTGVCQLCKPKEDSTRS